MIQLAVLLFALAASLARFLVEAHIDFNLWDEGYLWYGVQRVMHGEIPVRDFMSYDPGRYYWAACVLWLFHDHGIVAVRAATAAFGALGVAGTGLLVLYGSGGRVAMRVALSALAMTLCLLWMLPWWKSYDATMSVILTASLAGVLARPCVSRFFVHGVVVGLAAIVGRNHGVYGVIASLLAIPLLLLGADKLFWRSCIPAWLTGVVLGFSPVLVGLGIDHRFAQMFWDSIQFMLFEYKGTNLPLPIPWPWTVHPANRTLPTLIGPWLVGCLFVALPLLCAWGSTRVLRHAWRGRIIASPLFSACMLTSIPYLNVAFSRADVGHLAQAILPCMIGLFILPWSGCAGAVTRWLSISVFAASTLWVTLPLHAGYLFRAEPSWVSIEVGSDRLWVSADKASRIENIKALAKRYVDASGTILSIPVWPGAYALLGVKSPIYEIYPLLPRSEAFQEQEIVRLQQAAPQLILFLDIAVDGRDELRYVHTHSRIWEHVITHYHQTDFPAKDSQLKVYLPDNKK